MTAVRADECTIEADVDDLVATTEFALAQCRRLGTPPRDLWGQRASLDDVFLHLTGHAFAETTHDHARR